MLYNKKDLENSIFIQIETEGKEWNSLSKEERDIWEHRFHERFKSYGDTPQQSNLFCGKYITEFSSLKSFSIGVFAIDKKEELVISSDTITGNEKDLIIGIEKILSNATGNVLSGWNIINWQVPYLVKKFIKHKQNIPYLLDIKDKKPWEVNMHDVMRDYQGNMFGEIDLNLIALELDVIDKDSDIVSVLNIAKYMSK